MDTGIKQVFDRINEQRVDEALQGVDIYDLYAGWWVLQQPTVPEGNLRPQLKSEVEDRWYEVKRRVSENLISEGIMAITGEAKHFYRQALRLSAGDNRSDSDDTDERNWSASGLHYGHLPKRSQRVIEQALNQYGLADLKLSLEYSSESSYDYVGGFASLGPDDVELKWAWLERLAFGTSGFKDAQIRMQSILKKQDRNVLSSIEDEVQDTFGTDLKSLLEFCSTIFHDLSWESSFGGDSWGRITDEVINGYESFPGLEFEFIDHLIDLAHNTNVWIDKFTHDQKLLQALDDKFEKDPLDWAEKVSDRKIKGALRRI